MQNFLGRQIDQYQILEQVGLGGMAVVFKAYDTRLDRLVAIKLIRTDEVPGSQQERLMLRFEREAKAQARFIHPHIVTTTTVRKNIGPLARWNIPSEHQKINCIN